MQLGTYIETQLLVRVLTSQIQTHFCRRVRDSVTYQDILFLQYEMSLTLVIFQTPKWTAVSHLLIIQCNLDTNMKYEDVLKNSLNIFLEV